MTTKPKRRGRAGPGRPKTTGTGEQIKLRAHADYLVRLDKWRASQEIEPTRPQAIMHLSARALKDLGF